MFKGNIHFPFYNEISDLLKSLGLKKEERISLLY